MEVFLQELRKCSSEICELEMQLSPEEIAEHRDKVFHAVLQILQLHQITFKDGLWMLEEEAFKWKEDEEFHELYRMVLYIVDGISPEQIEQFAWSKYLINAPKGYHALRYLIWITGCLRIAEGFSAYDIERELTTFLPTEWEKNYKEYKEQQEEEVRSKKAKENERILDEIQQTNRWETLKEFYAIRLLDSIIRNADPESIRNLSTYLEESAFETILLATSEEAKTKILENASFENVENNPFLRNFEIVKRVQTILSKIHVCMKDKIMEQTYLTELTKFLEAIGGTYEEMPKEQDAIFDIMRGGFFDEILD